MHYCVSIMLKYMILACLLVSVCQQSCLRIDQDGEGIVHEPTDIHCVLKEGVQVQENDYLLWYMKLSSDDSSIRLAIRSHTDVTVTPGYEDKVSASWSDNVFTLRIKSISLDDDERHTVWRCDITATGECASASIDYGITVKGIY